MTSTQRLPTQVQEKEGTHAPIQVIKETRGSYWGRGFPCGVCINKPKLFIYFTIWGQKYLLCD